MQFFFTFEGRHGELLEFRLQCCNFFLRPRLGARFPSPRSDELGGLPNPHHRLAAACIAEGKSHHCRRVKRSSRNRFDCNKEIRQGTFVEKALCNAAFMDTSEAKTDDSQNASGERGGYVTPITVSPNDELSSSRCPPSLFVRASSLSSSPCNPRSATVSCSSRRWDLSPGCDDGFIPIACDRDDPGRSTNNVQLRSDSFYLRKRKGRGGWNRGRKRGIGKKRMKGVLNNDNNRSKEMGEVPISALQQPEMFYSKAMMMNPWSQLKPVVGCVLVPLPWAQEFHRSWLPDSVAVKVHSATCMSGERTMTPLRSRRQEQDRRSLADCLALSFEEAANE